MVDQARLDEWRARFSEGGVSDIRNPEFRRVALSRFNDDDRRIKPYAGIPTLLDAPLRDLGDDPQFPNDIDVGLIGVPMDLGVTNRPGARFGPRALRAIERVGPYHHVLKCLPFGERRVADLGDVPFRSRYSLEQSIEDIETYVSGLAAAGIRPVSAGGDHSISYPILKALGRDRPVGMVHIDAHCDTCGSIDGAKFHHGGPFRHAVLDGALDPDRTIQIGIRGASEFVWEFSYETGMTVIHAEDFHRMGVDAVIAKARAIVGDGPVYVSFDVDGLDPAYAPGTGTPEVGGLSAREAQLLLQGLDGLDIIGGDVVEVAPQYDATANTAHVGAQMLFEILCLTVRAMGPPSA